MGGSNLSSAYKQASKEAHKKDFLVQVEEGADRTKITLPRLSIGNRAKLELYIRERGEHFSLSALRQKARMIDVKCRGQAVEELVKGGLPESFKSDDEAGLWANLLKAKITSAFTDYVDVLFEGVTEEDQAYSIALALQQEEGSLTIEIDDEDVPIDIEFVQHLLEVEGESPMMPNMFLFVTNIAAQDEPEEEIAKTPQELLDRVKDDSGNEETETAD